MNDEMVVGKATTPRAPAGRFEWERALRQTAGLSWTLRGVLLTLATYADTKEGGSVRPSLARMAETLGVHRSVLTRNVAEGQRLGWLACTENNARRGLPSVYQLTVPEGETLTSATSSEPGDAPQRQGVTPQSTEGDAPREQGVTLQSGTTGSDTCSVTSTDTSTGPSVWDVIEQAAAAEAESRAAVMAGVV